MWYLPLQKPLNAVDVMITFCFHSSLDLSELAKAAKKKLQSVSKTSVCAVQHLYCNVANAALHLSSWCFSYFQFLNK